MISLSLSSNVDVKSTVNPFGMISSSIQVLTKSACSFMFMLFSLMVYIFHPSSVGSSVGSEFRFLVLIKLADGVTSLSLSSARSLVSARDIFFVLRSVLLVFCLSCRSRHSKRLYSLYKAEWTTSVHLNPLLTRCVSAYAFCRGLNCVNSIDKNNTR